MGDLNTDTDHNVSDFYDILSSNFYAPYILQPSRLTKNPKTIINNDFLNPNQFSTFSGNSPPQFLILKDFYHKTLINMKTSLNKITDFLVMMNLK